MSISTNWYAEYANDIKDRWVAELQAAILRSDWNKVEELADRMARFQFTE